MFIWVLPTTVILNLIFLWVQIENEYDTIMRAFKNKGTSYIHWAGKMAVSLKTGVPWIMCKQKNAPDQVVSIAFFILLQDTTNLLQRFFKTQIKHPGRSYKNY